MILFYSLINALVFVLLKLFAQLDDLIIEFYEFYMIYELFKFIFDIFDIFLFL